MHDTWKDMFVIGLPLAEKILRPIIVYVFLVVSLRLSGKRELVQLNPFDLVVLLTLSNTVQNAIMAKTTASWAESSALLPCSSPTIWSFASSTITANSTNWSKAEPTFWCWAVKFECRI